MNKDDYIKKLERRIHNQRVQLRMNWEILEMRGKYKQTPLRSMWFDKVKELIKENKHLKKQIYNTVINADKTTTSLDQMCEIKDSRVNS